MLLALTSHHPLSPTEYTEQLAEASTHKSTKNHAGIVSVPCDLNLKTPQHWVSMSHHGTFLCEVWLS